MNARRELWLVGAGAVGCAALGYLMRTRPGSGPVVASPPPHESVAAVDAGPAGEPEDDDRAYSFRVPSGEPAALTCEAARAIVGQARGSLAYEPESPGAEELAAGTADWLDPPGLWSAAPDAPIKGALIQRAADLVRELESPVDSGCRVAHEVGAVM